MKIEIFDKDGQKISRKEHRTKYQEHLSATTFSRQELISKGIVSTSQLQRATTKGLLNPIVVKSKVYFQKEEITKLIGKQ